MSEGVGSVLEGVRDSRLAGLRATRDVLAAAMDAAEPQVQAQLSAQLMKVLEQVEEIEARQPEVSESDAIKRDLADGLADASVVQLAGRRRKSGAG